MDQLRGLTLAEIFGLDKGDSPQAQVLRIWLRLFYARPIFSQLPTRDQYVWLIVNFKRELDNNGIDGFLFNSSGAYAIETMEALAAIGASEAHRLLKQACEFFPNGRPSEDNEGREDQVRAITAKFGEDVDRLVGLRELDYSNLDELLLDYWQRHGNRSDEAE